MGVKLVQEDGTARGLSLEDIPNRKQVALCIHYEGKKVSMMRVMAYFKRKEDAEEVMEFIETVAGLRGPEPEDGE